jgi:hypothetical protein
MFNTRELENATAKNTPYPGYEYTYKALEELEVALKIYLEYYFDKKYNISLSNGEEIGFNIAPSSVGHMFGLDTTKTKTALSANHVVDGRIGAMQLLKYIVDNKEEIVLLNEKLGNSILNPFRIRVRCEAFRRFSNFADMDFGCLHYDKDIANAKGYNIQMRAKQFLFTESNDDNAPYYMMGIAYDENTNNAYIETLFADIDSEKMFTNQLITFPLAVTTETVETFSRHESSVERRQLTFKNMSHISLKYNCRFDYSADYVRMLSDERRREAKQLVL